VSLTAAEPVPAPTSIADDPRFVELLVTSALDPRLAEAYAADPAAVLASFGVTVPAGAPLPELTADTADVEGLADPATTTFCWVCVRDDK
jgi:hypothetical protein